MARRRVPPVSVLVEEPKPGPPRARRPRGRRRTPRTARAQTGSRRRRWFFFFLSMALGLLAGLYYGWYVNPVQYADTTPDRLRMDFKTDYVLMVAEGFSRNQDVAWARHYLALLGASPEQVVEQAIRHAVVDLGYAPADVALMRDLLQALRRSSP